MSAARRLALASFGFRGGCVDRKLAIATEGYICLVVAVVKTPASVGGADKYERRAAIYRSPTREIDPDVIRQIMQEDEEIIMVLIASLNAGIL